MFSDQPAARTFRSGSVPSGKLGTAQLQFLSDESLCHKVTQGDHEAFLVLFDRYWSQVFRLARSVIRDQAEAEDVAQALFLEVHTSLLGFDEKRGSFRTLILRYAYTRAIDHRRWLVSRRFYSRVQFESVDPSMLVQDSGAASNLTAQETTHLIRQAMKDLDEKQRLTVEAYFFRGLSPSEIASELSDSFGNVRHHLYRGLEKMRKFVMANQQTEDSGEPAPRIKKGRLWPEMRQRLASEVPVVKTRKA